MLLFQTIWGKHLETFIHFILVLYRLDDSCGYPFKIYFDFFNGRYLLQAFEMISSNLLYSTSTSLMRLGLSLETIFEFMRSLLVLYSRLVHSPDINMLWRLFYPF